MEAGLRVIMMCIGSFLIDYRYTTLMGDADSGGGCACVRIGDIEESSIPSFNFAMNLRLL
jgi:hypothetical protein